MKHKLLLTLALGGAVVPLALVGCGGSNNGPLAPQTTPTTAATAQPTTVPTSVPTSTPGGDPTPVPTKRPAPRQTPPRSNVTAGNLDLTVTKGAGSNYVFSDIKGPAPESQPNGYAVFVVGADVAASGPIRGTTNFLERRILIVHLAGGTPKIGNVYTVRDGLNGQAGSGLLANVDVGRYLDDGNGVEEVYWGNNSADDAFPNQAGGTVTITALSATTLTLKLTGVKVVPFRKPVRSSDPAGTLTLNGTVTLSGIKSN